jgi:hypothetical protein
MGWSADGRVLLASTSEGAPFVLSCAESPVDVGTEVDVEMRIARDDAGRIEVGEVVAMGVLEDVAPEESSAAWRAWFAPSAAYWNTVEDPEAVLRAEEPSA